MSGSPFFYVFLARNQETGSLGIYIGHVGIFWEKLGYILSYSKIRLSKTVVISFY